MAVIPTQNAVKPKLPYEKQLGPASPYINTAPDVKTSEQISKGSPVPTQTTQVAAVPGQQSQTPPSTAIPGYASATGVSSIAPTASAAPATSPAAPASPETPKPTVTSAPAAATPTVTSPGAPPGIPETKPATPMIPTPKSIVGKTAAEQTKEQEENEYQRKLYEAALKQTEEGEGAERRAEGGLRSLTGRMGEAGTINSSLFGEGKNLIATGRAVDVSRALDTYNKSVREAQDFLTKAQVAYNRAMEEKRREEAEAGRKNEPKEAGPESAFIGYASGYLGFVPKPDQFIQVKPGEYVYVTPQEYAGGIRPVSTGKVTVGHKVRIG